MRILFRFLAAASCAALLCASAFAQDRNRSSEGQIDQPAPAGPASAAPRSPAEPAYDPAKERIEATHRGVVRHCQALNEPARDICLKRAEEDYVQAMAGAGKSAPQRQEERRRARESATPGG